MRDDASHLFQFDKKLTTALKNNKNPDQDFCLVGIDEAGRGPWAGPVVASAVILHPHFFDPSVNDSKKLPVQLRQNLAKKIQENSFWSIGSVEVERIDSLNILNAAILAMKLALQSLLNQNPHLKPDLVLIDGRSIPNLLKIPQVTVVKGDSKSASIASASIIAKVERDKMMVELDQTYPHYGFSKHKGYGTELHRKNLIQHGPSPVHRKSFSPIKEMIRDPRYVFHKN